MAGLAAGLGLVTYAVGTDGSFALTQRMDPTLATLDRNRMIGGGVLTAVGLALAAFVSPILGAGVAAGGLAALAGTQVSNALGHLIDKKNPDGSLQTAQPAAPLAASPSAAALNGVFDPSGQQRLGGVFGGGGQLIGGVFDPGGQQQLGSPYGEYFGG